MLFQAVLLGIDVKFATFDGEHGFDVDKIAYLGFCRRNSAAARQILHVFNNEIHADFAND